MFNPADKKLGGQLFENVFGTNIRIFTTLWSSTLSEYNSPYYLYCGDGSMSILVLSSVALNGLNTIRANVFLLNSI